VGYRVPALLAFLLVLTGCFAGSSSNPSTRPAAQSAATPSSSLRPAELNGTLLDPPLPPPAQTLNDTAGRRFSIAASSRTELTLLFFGYTHCPDVCPTTMGEMTGWFADLGDEADTLKAFFVTVDPERDTPEILDGYVSWVSDRVTGVTGKPEEVAKMVKAWKVLAEKVPGQGSDYTMNHTASVFLVNAEGGFEGTIAYQEATPTAIAKIRKLLGKAA